MTESSTVSQSDDIEYYSISSEQFEDCLYPNDNTTEDYSVSLLEGSKGSAVEIT